MIILLTLPSGCPATEYHNPTETTRQAHGRQITSGDCHSGIEYPKIHVPPQPSLPQADHPWEVNLHWGQTLSRPPSTRAFSARTSSFSLLPPLASHASPLRFLSELLTSPVHLCLSPDSRIASEQNAETSYPLASSPLAPDSLK